MPEVYEIMDDDVVLVDAPPPALPSPTRTTRRHSSPDKSPHKQALTNSHANGSSVPVKHSPVDEVLPPEAGSSARGPSPAQHGAEEMKVEAPSPLEAMETDGGGGVEKQKELIQLPILDTSDPAPASVLVHLEDTSASANNNDAGSSNNVDAKPSSSSLSPPALNGLVAAAAAEEKSKKPTSTSVKPKSKRRSPSPEPPPPPPPRVQTIRLDISLGGPENYAVNIVQLAKETGQRPPTPPPVKRDTDSSESEGEGDGGRKGIGKGKGKGKAGRRSIAAEYYDVNDPFIDDSELAIDERTYFAQTKQQGFYVSSGEVALLKDKSRDRESRERDGVGTSPKKPKSKRTIVPTIIPLAGSQAVNAAVASSAGLSTSTAPPPSQSAASPTDPFAPQQLTVPSVGTRETPITLSDTEEGRISAQQPPSGGSVSVSANGISANTNNSALKRKASETSATGKKKRKTVEIESFHPELQAALYELKDAIARESFDQKGKFPPALKPILARVALKAIAVGEYNDNFFALMPKLFIYNKYTMTKLIKRTVYADHQKLLVARQEELIEELRGIAEEGFDKAKEEYDKSVQAWERRQEKTKAGGTSLEGTPAPGSTTPSVNGVPLPQADGGADSSMEVDGAPPLTQASGSDKDKGHVHSSHHMPIQRFRLTERMRNIIWELVVLSNESVRIENEKNTLENSTVQVSEQGTRKVLYQKVVAAFPEGWMTSGQISREVSVMKKRYEAQQAEGVS